MPARPPPPPPLPTTTTFPKLSPIRRLYYKWLSLRFPWRKKYLVGLDLQGNTFYEFRTTPLPPLSSSSPQTDKYRYRRIVHYNRSSSSPFRTNSSTSSSGFHYADVTVSPQWHQWLRHTRPDPPSLQEQVADMQRLGNLKVLAQLADRRWSEKKKEKGRSVLEEGPTANQQHQHQHQQTVPGTKPRDRGAYQRAGDVHVDVAGTEVGVGVGVGIGARAGAGAAGATSATAVEEEVEGGGSGEVRHENTAKRRESGKVEEEERGKGEESWEVMKRRSRSTGPSETWQPEAWDPNKGR